MAKFLVQKSAPLKGEVTISGAKNAAVAILPAALLVQGVSRIENVPDISDVRILLRKFSRQTRSRRHENHKHIH